MDAHHVLHVYKMLKNLTLEAEKNKNKIKAKHLISTKIFIIKNEERSGSEWGRDGYGQSTEMNR